ncbi:hypothetical protein HDU83_009163 [Entophlyctis luteolus]|nr:hypothetical protein HDU82_006420 [Entophlyctis luteolus]KAJ3356993.1 hypothetical protein HDU83_009163 [Entophlyctis luteolus]KAJ3394291.1 hypothetical protein HDU84_009046 [Entophlyctis sp. JEL0112]
MQTLDTLLALLTAVVLSLVSAQSNSSLPTVSGFDAVNATALGIAGDTGGPAVAGAKNIGSVKTFTWNVDYVEDITRSNYTRRMIGVNNTWPIPAMVIDFNDTFVLNVKNNLDKGVAIHFHGLSQYGTTRMDGAGMMSQCLIPPGSTYTYTWTATQWGSYWGEYVDGLRTPLTINPPPAVKAALNQFDEEFVVSVADFYHLEHPVVIQQFLGIYNPSGAEPVPDAGLLNEVDNPQQVIEAGKSYKVRVVSMAALVTYDMYLEGHDMYVVEVDGVDVQPSLQSSFSIGPAQRVSFLFKARSAGNGTDVNYNFHAVMESSMFENAPENLVYDVTMPFIYNTSASAQMFPADNTTVPDFDDIMDELSLVPVFELAALENPATANSFHWDVSFQVFTDGVNHGSFNNTPFVYPKVPSLYSALSVGSAYINNPAVYGANANAMVVENLGDVLEIIIANGDSGKHPFHLHGHQFQLIQLTNETFDPMNPYPDSIAPNPVRRDTVNIPGGGYAIFRLVGQNPGLWFLHCHIEWHFEAGLAAILVEAPSSIKETIDSNMLSFCAAQGVPVSGNAAGNTALDMTGYVSGPSTLYIGIPATGWGAIVACAISSFIGVATVIWFSKKDELSESKARQ